MSSTGKWEKSNFASSFRPQGEISCRAGKRGFLFLVMKFLHSSYLVGRNDENVCFYHEIFTLTQFFYR